MDLPARVSNASVNKMELTISMPGGLLLESSCRPNDFHNHAVSILQSALMDGWPPPGAINIKLFVEHAVGLYVNAAFNLLIGLSLAQIELKAA